MLLGCPRFRLGKPPVPRAASAGRGCIAPCPRVPLCTVRQTGCWHSYIEDGSQPADSPTPGPVVEGPLDQQAIPLALPYPSRFLRAPPLPRRPQSAPLPDTQPLSSSPTDVPAVGICTDSIGSIVTESHLPTPATARTKRRPGDFPPVRYLRRRAEQRDDESPAAAGPRRRRRRRLVLPCPCPALPYPPTLRPLLPFPPPRHPFRRTYPPRRPMATRPGTRPASSTIASELTCSGTAAGLC